MLVLLFTNMVRMNMYYKRRREKARYRRVFCWTASFSLVHTRLQFIARRDVRNAFRRLWRSSSLS